jgi:tRNA(Arg) A34 adenosine deaminase TadA
MSGTSEYFDLAFEEAWLSVRNNIGGPFGAVVVKEGKIIGKGGNRVLGTNDPTAHAEIVAIREACSHVENFDLAGAEIYATCEPCPMCLAAIYWAGIGKVYYSLTRADAERIGFRDKHIYDELPLDPSQRKIPFIKVEHPSGEVIFSEWMHKSDKKPY